ncbi:double-strand break repair protein AddB [Donghicola mangrovi]|uniref:double-strand break repair protein AddB n=1 Tax=Donghicola mangrovi TaxID=2729614 RepID=UPI001D1471EA|nr:double-strand break repair protein AddB [Donghicola mangrovi]
MALFEPTSGPRLFALPMGVDFTAAFTKGLIARLDHLPPHEQARVEVYVNTARMRRRMTEIFDQHGSRLLPRIRLIGELADLPGPNPMPPAVPTLRKRLELVTLIRQLLVSAPEIAPRTALFSLADSLAALMDEMQSEGCDPQKLHDLDVTDQSGHWQRALAFVRIVEQFLENSATQPDRLGRQRMIVTALEAYWQDNVPQHPVIIAGSTGSRGATSEFMKIVAALPQGAIVLPGFDYDLPGPVWDTMGDVLTAEDHPQYRFRNVMNLLGVDHTQIPLWDAATPANDARNKLVSLALRPAPVTDAWLAEGPRLPDLTLAADGLTLLEAPDPRTEANAIALVMRETIEQGRTAALVSPDPVLNRMVKAALDRWNLTPDDSKGDLATLAPPGRILRQVAELYGTRVGADALLRVLKHPLTHSGHLQEEDPRGNHLRRTRDMELEIRRKGVAYPDADWLRKWIVDRYKGEAGTETWAEWIIDTLLTIPDFGEAPLQQYVEDHIERTICIVAGPEGETSTLWRNAAGRVTKPMIDEFRREAHVGGDITAFDYVGLLHGVLSGNEIRDRDTGHPMLGILGTRDVRVEQADVMILAGLNEGTWPSAPKPDPWLNRAMRARVGLNLPERQIGLAAHDFQQAITLPNVVISRAIRSDDAQTVPSRWLNRLTNLMSGLPENGGREALADMRTRGQRWVQLAEAMETPGSAPRATRPSPCPPIEARPRQLSVTEIQTLIRDPYAIYAKHVLKLRRLDPLGRDPDARLRGTVLHRVLELFTKSGPVTGSAEDKERLMNIAEDVLEEEVPWTVTRTFYRGRIEKFANWFVQAEAHRQTYLETLGREVGGGLTLGVGDFTLIAKADRIDKDDKGRLHLFDYKTGGAPAEKEQTYFDKQLLLMAMMAEEGAFTGIDPAEVASATYISLRDMEETAAPLEAEPTDKIKGEFFSLLSSYRDADKGYTSRRAVKNENFEGDFDHLARYGEWEPTDDANPEVLE